MVNCKDQAVHHTASSTVEQMVSQLASTGYTLLEPDFTTDEPIQIGNQRDKAR